MSGLGQQWEPEKFKDYDPICFDIVEAHCYFVDIGRTDREQIF